MQHFHVIKHKKLTRYDLYVILTIFLISLVKFGEILTLGSIISPRVCSFNNTISFRINHKDRQDNILLE